MMPSQLLLSCPQHGRVRLHEITIAWPGLCVLTRITSSISTCTSNVLMPMLRHDSAVPLEVSLDAQR